LGRTVIRNATIFTATGEGAFAGDLVVEGNRIAAVAKGGGADASGSDTVIDATGKFCMPGMTEGHGHISFENVTATEHLITPTPEEQVFTAARGAKALLEAGFTSVYGASEAKLRLGVAVRNEIAAGRIKGPRIRAGGLEISVTGAMGDESTEHNPRIGPSTLINGPEEMRKTVRFHIREGVDNIKLDVSGDPFYAYRAGTLGTPSDSTPMHFDEIKAAVDTAHALGRKVNAHTRSIQGSKDCVRAGVDGLLHCEHSDEELLDMMEEAKDRIFVVPTMDLFHQMSTGGASEWGITPEVAAMMGIPPVVEDSIRTHTELRKRGVRHLIGGDYGFAWSPQGTQGRDLGYFVDYYGYSVADALVCATRNGGLAMDASGDLGTLEAGKLADLILVDGDVLSDVGLLNGPENIAMVMKDGAIQCISPALEAQAGSPALQAAE
jgi:imidazolonepropionase-like amidohydrolase